ncbi:unnamed protein product, partial [marine sediment metagenome]
FIGRKPGKAIGKGGFSRSVITRDAQTTDMVQNELWYPEGESGAVKVLYDFLCYQPPRRYG